MKLTKIELLQRIAKLEDRIIELEKYKYCITLSQPVIESPVTKIKYSTRPKLDGVQIKW
jgi:hypothetical protein